jgi:protein-L-isoaspartate(D-aspartate) O-methyltransferase
MQNASSSASRGALSLRLYEQGIRDPRLLAAFERVSRAAFVPAELRDEAEADRALDIGMGQTISQPFIVAAMTFALRLSGRERVLEVGTGSGYQTAILAEMLPLEAVVRTVELRPELLRRAQDTLLSLGYRNVDFRLGDGALGWPEAAPFDAILVAAAPHQVPAPLLEQLAPGGRLVIPVGSDLDHQDLALGRKDPRTGRCHRDVLMGVRFVPLVPTLH